MIFFLFSAFGRYICVACSKEFREETAKPNHTHVRV